MKSNIEDDDIGTLDYLLPSTLTRALSRILNIVSEEGLQCVTTIFRGIDLIFAGPHINQPLNITSFIA